MQKRKLRENCNTASLSHSTLSGTLLSASLATSATLATILSATLAILLSGTLSTLLSAYNIT